MKRKEFLQRAGLAGVGMAFAKWGTSSPESHSPAGGCVLTPWETAGPFPLDLTENTFFLRQDVREDEPGVLLTLRMRIMGYNNCEPMPNVRVNIWQCNHIGQYSGYDVTTNPGQDGLTYLRGYQFTDVNGEAEFVTILPGFYPGRICHIHFQVYVSSSNAAISQLTFPLDTKNAIYLNNPDLYPDGEDPLGYGDDGVFADGYNLQLATLEEDPETGGYKSFIEVTVDGEGTTGVGYLENRADQFAQLGQNFPNPFADHTRIPFTLHRNAHVNLKLFDVNGKQVAVLRDEPMNAGSHEVLIQLEEHNLSRQNYIYQLEVELEGNKHHFTKMMTCAR